MFGFLLRRGGPVSSKSSDNPAMALFSVISNADLAATSFCTEEMHTASKMVAALTTAALQVGTILLRWQR
jgi:hypothetical protein